MPDNLVENGEWAEWHRISLEIARYISKGNLREALAAVEKFQPSVHDPELLGRVLSEKAGLMYDLGQFSDAERAWRLAHRSTRANFTRYVQELSIAELCLASDRHEEASSWYRSALTTSLEANISGGTALVKFLLLQPETELSEADLQLCRSVASRSSKLLGMTEVITPGNLGLTAQSLVKQESLESRANDQ